MADFKLQVYTQEKKIYDDDVTSIVVPGLQGYFGVLAHHAPLLAALGQGKLTVRKGAEEHVYEIAGGFLEVRDNIATMLVDKLREAA
ncbi:ATP synthase F1 subunit epsilon [bacterium]|nr:ATP synthase F1 subunit epsilon [bacterium]